MKIIGITGTLGAGKGTIVDYFINKRGFVHYSVRAFLIEEIKKRKLPVNRDSMTYVANDLRAKHSPTYIVEQLYNEAQKSGCNCVIESLRAPAEVEFLKKYNDFYLFAVTADAELRYKRISLRKSETDNVTYETFLANEEREMSSNDSTRQNLKKCIEQADVLLCNNSTIDELYKIIEINLKQIEL